MSILKGLLTKTKAIGLVVGAITAGFASTYMLVDKRVETIDLTGKIEEPEPAEETYFGNFISRLAPLANTEAELEDAFGLEATFNDFSVEWPGNKISVDGFIDLSMRSLLNMDFTIDLDVNYNEKAIDVALGLVDEELYVATKDLGLKVDFADRGDAKEEFIEMYDKIYNLFFNTENEDGLQMELQLGAILGNLLGGADLSSLTSSMGGFSVTETKESGFVFSNIAIDLGDSEINISLKFDEETSNLLAVDLGTITLGNVTIKGGLITDVNSSNVVYGFDNPFYTYKTRGDFVEVFNYTNWIDDIFNLLKTRQIGLDIKASLVDEDKSLGELSAAIDVDATRFKPLDISGLVIGPELFGLAPVESEETTNEESFLSQDTEETEGLDILELLNNFDFNVGVTLSNSILDGEQLKKVDYSNLNLAYFKDADQVNKGYISFNDEENTSVMKAKIGVDTINYLINEVPALVSSLSTNENSLFDFVTSSALVSAINEGKYDGILDVLENISSTKDDITLVLNLSSLGFGSNAKVTLKLDASDDENRKPVSIDVTNAIIAGKTLNVSINTRDFNGASFAKINENRNTYDELDFIEGTFDQVKAITDSKQVGFTLEGSVLDEKSLGFDFDGWAQLDYGDLNGMGSITLNEYKYESRKTITPHTVDISIDDLGKDHANNNMYFEYRDALKGKFTLKTFDDIIELVMDLTKLEDNRFTKFLAPILEQLAGSIIVTAINDTNYLSLTQSSLIKSIKQVNDGMSLQIVLSKELLMDFIDDDLAININFKRVEEKKAIDSIEISDLVVSGKTINFKAELADYDENKVNPVDLSTGNFLDFSDIAVLLEFGINTTELNVYHLTADVALKLKLVTSGGSNLIDVALDFYVYVNGETTKVYGKLPNNELHKGYSEIVFEPSHDDNDKIGGYFHIIRHENGNILTLWQPKTTYYYSDSQNFLDNIITYLVCDFLGVNNDLVNGIGDLNLGEETETDPKWENILEASDSFPAFSYYKNNAQQDEWKVRVNLEAITENDKLGAVEATITGANYDGVNYLSSAKVKMTIASVLIVDADIELIDPNPEEKVWPQSVETRYQEIIAIYNGLTDAKKANATNPNKGASI